MMWSRTSMANKALSLRIGDKLAKYATLGLKNIGKLCRQIAKCHQRTEQHVEPRIGQLFNRGGQTALMRPIGPVRRGDMADLARNELEPAAVEGAAKQHRHLGIAIPAQFEHS